MEKIVLYTTHCPKCNILKAKLNEKNIQYVESEDVITLSLFGFKTVPILEVEGQFLEFKAAVDWVNQQ